jgi:putative membrane protein insertion efficiency factor
VISVLPKPHHPSTVSSTSSEDPQRDRSPMVKCVLLLIRCYQIVLSPLWGPTCRFVPSCSEYAHEALNRYGLSKGTWLALGRIFRCHPFHPGGYDPVP